MCFSHPLPTYLLLPCYFSFQVCALVTPCPYIAHILPTYCPHIARILPTHCPHIAHTLPAYCPHIAHILPTYSAALSPPCPHIYCCHVTLRLWCGFVWCLVSTRLHSTHPLHCYTARGKCRHEVAIYFLALVAWKAKVEPMSVTLRYAKAKQKSS